MDHYNVDMRDGRILSVYCIVGQDCEFITLEEVVDATTMVPVDFEGDAKLIREIRIHIKMQFAERLLKRLKFDECE
jgi:hypothetical protein